MRVRVCVRVFCLFVCLCELKTSYGRLQFWMSAITTLFMILFLDGTRGML